MGSKLSLLKAFYEGLLMDRAKVETSRWGFSFLESLLADGVRLDYGEVMSSGLLHKYKLTHISPSRMDDLLRAHLASECNVCLYFHQQANRLFCLNLDNNHKVNDTALIPEVEEAARELETRLGQLGCEPLVLASGRGYHLWGRLASPVPNGRSYHLMLHAAAHSLQSLLGRGLEPRRLKINFYPDPRSHDVVSLRLFGALHAKNGVFSRVKTPTGLLGEEASWEHFEDHLNRKTIALPVFDAACAALGLPAEFGLPAK